MGKFSNLYYQTFEPDSMPPYQRGEDTIFGIMTTLTSQNLILIYYPTQRYLIESVFQGGEEMKKMRMR